MRPLFIAVLGLVAPLLLAGCASGGRLDSSSKAVSVATNLPPPDPNAPMMDFTNYRIGPLDVIRVEVFGAAELNREGEVDSAGNFSLPLVGTVAAGGRTPDELRQQIVARLQGRYVKNPQVSVQIQKARGMTFTVDGAVRQPGIFPIVGKLSLQQAIATARGADEMANLGNVVIFRQVNNQKMAALYNLKDIRNGRLPDPTIYGNDIIIVGENATRRFFIDIRNTFPLLGTFVPIL